MPPRWPAAGPEGRPQHHRTRTVPSQPASATATALTKANPQSFKMDQNEIRTCPMDLDRLCALRYYLRRPSINILLILELFSNVKMTLKGGVVPTHLRDIELSQSFCSAAPAASNPTVFSSHTALAPSSSHQPTNIIFFSHHSSHQLQLQLQPSEQSEYGQLVILGVHQ